MVHAQTKIEVRGIVKDQKGETLPGVNISVKGTTTGTMTNLDGNYVINAPGKQSVLVFSFIGYKNQEVPVGNQKEMALF